MNYNKFLFFILLTSCLLSSSIVSPKGFGGCFGGSFLGGFSGSIIGNAISQPRQPRAECVYQQPVQTRVVEVHRPTYIEVKSPKKIYKTEHRNQQRMQQDALAQQQQITNIQAQAEQRTATLQKNCEDTVAAQQLAQKMKDLELKEKELELKKVEAELAKTNAENEKLRLELQKLQVHKEVTTK